MPESAMTKIARPQRLESTQPRRTEAPAREVRSARRAYAAAFVAILLVAAALRVAASRGEFWLDEVWSYNLAAEAKGPLDALLGIRVDNSHPLNTLLMYWIGPDQAPAVYRIPSILAGVGAAALAGLIALRWGRLESITVLAMSACSFLLIQYSSEARGYSLAIFFSMLSLLLGMRYVERPRWWIAALLWASLAAAVLSHLTAAVFYASFLLWSSYALLRAPGNGKGAAGAILTLHAVPLSLLTLYYMMCVRKMEMSGGNNDGTLNILARALTLWVGAPRGAAGALAAFVALVAAALGLWLLARKGSRLWVFFGSLVPLFASIPLVAPPNEAIFERHFLVCLSFGLILLGLALAWPCSKGAWGKAIFGIALAGFLAGNTFHAAWLLKVGRGQCVELVRYLDRNSPGEVVSVAGLYDFRTYTMLRFHLGQASFHKTLHYVPRERDDTEIAYWFIQDRREYAPVAPYLSVRGIIYEWATTFEMTSPQHPICLSGWSWDVYRLAARPS
jgi:hypothetical protein